MYEEVSKYGSRNRVTPISGWRAANIAADCLASAVIGPSARTRSPCRARLSMSWAPEIAEPPGCRRQAADVEHAARGPIDLSAIGGRCHGPSWAGMDIDPTSARPGWRGPHHAEPPPFPEDVFDGRRVGGDDRIQRMGHDALMGPRAEASTERDTTVSASAYGKPLHSTERAKDVTVHYRWHPLYGQMARVNRSLPSANGELLFCELPDGTRGTLPAWMTNAAACAGLTIGPPVVSIQHGRQGRPDNGVHQSAGPEAEAVRRGEG